MKPEPMIGEEAVARALCANSMGCRLGDRYPDDRQTLCGNPLWESFSGDARAAISAHLAALERAGLVVVPREPTTEMLRALLRHRGYDPDAKEETLDPLGQLDVATMGTFIAAYRAMVVARASGKE